MKLFLILIVIFIVLIFLSFLPRVKKFLVTSFNSPQFQAIRFIITCFGIITVILGYLNWYSIKNPKSEVKEISFQIDIFNMPILKKNISIQQKNIDDLEKATFSILGDPFTMCFFQGWKPVITEIDMNHNAIANSFSENKGILVNEEQLKPFILKYNLPPTIRSFYIPPDSIFNIEDKIVSNRSWRIITISNSYIELRIEFTTFKDICYAKIFYYKKGFINHLFFDYQDFNRWVNIIQKKILRKQEMNKEINQKRLWPKQSAS